MSASPIEVVGQWLQNLLDPSQTVPRRGRAPRRGTVRHLNHRVMSMLTR